MSWNIEGFRRNHFNLKYFCDKFLPDLVFLSEPQLYRCDIALLSKPFLGTFSFLLNSEETSHPELAMDCSKAHGGTLVMWKSKLDPYIQPLPTSSPAFLPILLSIPGFSPSIHIAIYLPTSGRNPECVSALSHLDSFIEEVAAPHECPIYIKGDANCNPRNTERTDLFKHFCSKHNFVSIDFCHPSHHHFTGNGFSDAQLDVLLYQPVGKNPPENLYSMVCKLDNPLVESAHDIIISTCKIPAKPPILQDISENIVAPKVHNNSPVQFSSILQPCRV